MLTTLESIKHVLTFRFWSFGTINECGDEAIPLFAVAVSHRLFFVRQTWPRARVATSVYSIWAVPPSQDGGDACTLDDWRYENSSLQTVRI